LGAGGVRSSRTIPILMQFINIFDYCIQKKFLIFLFKIVSNLIRQIQIKNQTLEIKTNSKNIYPLSLFLKKHSSCQYKILVDLITYDCPGKLFRFTLLYNLLSIDYNSRITISTKLIEYLPVITTIVPLYPGAGWLEREVFDLFGIFFIKHNDLRRILTDYGFIGYPLRKDFPLTGFIEIVYDDSQKHITYKPVELAQEFRNFSFKNTCKI
jgi:NADH:ubiquinone oxidoreductase subunit C